MSYWKKYSGKELLTKVQSMQSDAMSGSVQLSEMEMTRIDEWEWIGGKDVMGLLDHAQQICIEYAVFRQRKSPPTQQECESAVFAMSAMSVGKKGLIYSEVTQLKVREWEEKAIKGERFNPDLRRRIFDLSNSLQRPFVRRAKKEWVAENFENQRNEH